MRNRIVLLTLMLLSACGTAMQAQLDRYETTALAYQRAIRWSDFPTAWNIALEPGTVAAPDFTRLKDFRVTSYEAGPQQADEKAATIVQMVEIRYVNVSQMVEKVIVDKQTWRYSDKDQRWYLKSPFPAFE